MGKTKDNRVTVRIYGEDHVLKGNSSPEHMIQMANFVDRQMASIKEKNPRLSSTKVAIMACLMLADQHHKLKEECNQLYNMLVEYEEERGAKK
ncbi:cell division protein ZapA [Alkalicella caledoniensis]|uniref:Cell division protein ZapA n=1 Tax=Alkalicella caledoniensis TaxID=2731377 RepID=A0A7G9WAJ3_ALKCA|nr:cell division protein ZapA [Alkalicella caledoniensis]QNO15705.1 cell division protein ZapA [Alkalicella caledoniensis]